jgi:hypothetical protein
MDKRFGFPWSWGRFDKIFDICCYGGSEEAGLAIWRQHPEQVGQFVREGGGQKAICFVKYLHNFRTTKNAQDVPFVPET